MKISQLRSRESYDASLKMNVTKLLSLRYPHILVENAPATGHFVWYRHLLYDVYMPANPAKTPINWLAALYAKSPSLLKTVPQWLICQTSKIRRFDAAFMRPAFSTNIELSANTFIMPGNQRFRLFDFDTNKTLVATKTGFASDSICHEIEFRQRRDLPDFVPPLIALTPEAYEEPLLDARPINRLWLKKSQSAAKTQLVRVLKELSELDASTELGANYAQKLGILFNVASTHAKNRFFGLSTDAIHEPFKRALKTVAAMHEVLISRSHGDFQPGNILLDGEGRLMLIDWEDTNIRAACYDAMVFALQARFPSGLADRVHDFLKDSDPLPDYLSIYGVSRKELVSLWLCEDIIWRLTTSSRSGIRMLPPEMAVYFREMLALEL